MRFLYSVIFLFVIAGTGCSENNIVPDQEETEVSPFKEIEVKYGISISDNEDIVKLLNVVESGTTLSVNYLKSNNEISVLVFDTENKRGLGRFNLNKESVIVGEDSYKKELKAVALIINRRMSDYLYGYLYFSEIGSVDIESYQLFSSKVNSNKPIYNKLFGSDFYGWVPSGYAFSVYNWHDDYVLIKSDISHPSTNKGYYILDKNNEIIIDGSTYEDYQIGLNSNGIITYDKTAVIISNGLYIYDLKTNQYHQIDIDIKEGERLDIDNIEHVSNTAVIDISLINGSKADKRQIIVDLVSYNVKT
ncbi:hypothetical protein [Albibacterium profundi]|uniref:Uncharacterized protein n=1 Tax=Albibacterium profundi TaxID=3134906 RepID=A0ABV5CEZ7_9SPHI